MCGIAGLLDLDRSTGADELGALAATMAMPLAHRGPDDEGVWVDAAAGIALGHRRLAVIDLTSQGRQPMTSPSRRYVISYNGELYNFRALRRELGARGHRFRGGSDTEVLLAAVDEWGVAGALRRSVGMFAFALWDARDRVLHLARDRMGEKPLYVARWGRRVLVGSELRSLLAAAGARPAVDVGALTAFVRYGYVPAPASILEGVTKLPPGCHATIRSDGAYETSSYWSLADLAREPAQVDVDLATAADRLRDLLDDAVAGQLVADVPVGLFLSGGVDSSLVADSMRRQSSGAVRTFTIGFEDESLDEAPFAREVARRLGTDHTELYVADHEATDVVPRLPDVYDEPFADASQIPTFLVARLAAGHVTVCLTGDGGDELFAGYDRYHYADLMQRSVGRAPVGLRRAGARAVAAVPPSAWDRLLGGRAADALAGALRVRPSGDRIRKLADLLSFESRERLYLDLVSVWKEPREVVIGDGRGEPTPWVPAGTPAFPDFVSEMQYVDSVGYLPDDLLVKVDRAAMASSLETRVPFLDHRLVEFAWQLPPALRRRGRRGKLVPRRLLRRVLPPELVDRPKSGFGVPLAAWLRGPLREWACDLLDARTIGDQGYFDPLVVEARLRDHLSGERNWHYPLWHLLMFQAWLARYSAAHAA